MVEAEWRLRWTIGKGGGFIVGVGVVDDCSDNGESLFCKRLEIDFYMMGKKA